MAVNVYILFPEHEEQIFSVIETHGKFDTYIKEAVCFFKTITKSGVKLYYDSENIAYYFDTCSFFMDDSNDINIGRDMFRRFLSKASINVNTRLLKDGACKYVLWNYDKSPNVVDPPHKILIEMTERKYQYPLEESVLLDSHNSLESCREVLLTFKDAKHKDECPAPFVRIPHVLSQEELELWLKTNHIKSFSLFDKTRFQRTGRVYHAKPVFQEIATRDYWYLDNLHRDEYEVFNSSRNHIGTATLEGQMNPNSSVKGRVLMI